MYELLCLRQIVVHFTGRSYGNLTPLELINAVNHGT